MIAFLLAPVMLGLHILVLYWAFRALGAFSPNLRSWKVRIPIITVYLLLFVTMYVAFFLKVSPLKRILHRTGSYWYGVSIYIFMVAAVVLLVRLLVKLVLRNHEALRARILSVRMLRINSLLCLLLVALVSIYGAVHARRLTTTNYEITIDKSAGQLQELQIAMAADLHLGYTVGQYQLRQMVDRINAQNPDIIILAGDIFDNDYDAMQDPESLISLLQELHSRYGVYAVYGNHDVAEPIIGGFTFNWHEKKVSDARMDDFLQRAGITLLMDEGLLIDNSFYLYGRPDFERPGRGIDQRKSPEEITADLDPTLPVIVIDHEPRELGELAEAGVDLDLSGHTHDGQFFPMNLTGPLTWENSCGLLQKGNMTSIVTSGVGVYGPALRIGTDAEACSITVHFR